MKLSQKFCESAPPGIFWDNQLPGFGLRVHPKTKTFVLFVRDSNKKKKQVVIGHLAEMNLNQAREKARTIKSNKPAELEMTAGNACDLYLSEQAIPHNRSWQQTKRRIEKTILPVFGNRSMISITPPDVLAWHRSISAPYYANRALENLSAVFNYQIKMCRLACPNPCRAVHPNPEHPRDRFLSLDEFRRLFAALDSVKPIPSAIIKMLILTGRRKAEVLQMRWSDVDIAIRCKSFVTAKKLFPSNASRDLRDCLRRSYRKKA